MNRVAKSPVATMNDFVDIYENRKNKAIYSMSFLEFFGHLLFDWRPSFMHGSVLGQKTVISCAHLPKCVECGSLQ